MNTGDRTELVQKNFKQTKNCAEAILLTFENEIDMKPVEIKAMTAGFERGMFVSDTCGIVTGAVMLLGFVFNDDSIMQILNKRRVGKRVQKFMNEFKETNKSLNCKELKKTHKSNCNDLLVEAVKILEKIIN